jgi:hypothetical protein
LPVVTRAVGGVDDDAFGYLIQETRPVYLNSWARAELSPAKLWSMTAGIRRLAVAPSVTITATRTLRLQPWNAHVVKVVGNDIVSPAAGWLWPSS